MFPAAWAEEGGKPGKRATSRAKITKMENSWRDRFFEGGVRDIGDSLGVWEKDRERCFEYSMAQAQGVSTIWTISGFRFALHEKEKGGIILNTVCGNIFKEVTCNS